MYESLPKLDRAKLRQRLQAEFDRALDEVAEAVDRAPAGRVIRQSEEPARNALDRFRQVIYQEVVQAQVDAAEAAFPPSAQRGDRQTSATSRPPAVQPADDQRPFAVVARSLALPARRE